ncbi:MAG TPA: DUF1064 domain-containing protein [Steroidobacteraceae bacterium]
MRLPNIEALQSILKRPGYGARDQSASHVERAALTSAPPPPRASKFGNERTEGYASKREHKRAIELRLMQEAGQIRNLREQVSYELVPKQDGERAMHYVADFAYDEWTAEGWRPVTEDCKGHKTEVYRIKRKLMLFVLGIRVRET